MQVVMTTRLTATAVSLHMVVAQASSGMTQVVGLDFAPEMLADAARRGREQLR